MTPSRFRCWTVLFCSMLRECCWCVRCTTFICLCGKAKEDIFSPSDSQPLLSSLPVSPLWNCYINLPYELSQSLYILFLWEISLSPSVFSTLHLSAYDSVYLQSFLSLSFPPPPPPLPLPQRHLRSISVFSPPSMCLQPFSHPTSNQTYSAYWWSSKGPQVDFYLRNAWSPFSAPLLSNPTPPQLQSTTSFFSGENLSFGCKTHGTDTMALDIKSLGCIEWINIAQHGFCCT